MTVADILTAVEGRIVVGDDQDRTVSYGFASDLMSDVLTVMQDDVVLITGLSNLQTIRTATMADISVILLVRNKRATPDMHRAAEENGLMLLETAYSMFRVSGILYQIGLRPVF
ncbi:MAG: DRTGG domain-containing protein [Spirochaetaceae bacterium]